MTIAYFRKLRSVPTDVWRVLPMNAVYRLSCFGVYGVAFSLYLLRLGYGPSFVGQASSVGVLVYTLAALPAGLLARRWSPRRMMILGALAESSALGLLGLADLIPALWRSGWIMGAETLLGLGSAGLVSLDPTLMAAAGPAARDQAFALMAATGPLATMVGNLLGGCLPGLLANTMGTTLADPLPFRWTLLIGAVLILPAIPPLLRCDAARGVLVAKGAERNGRFPVAPIAAMSIVTAVLWVTLGGVGQFWTIYMDARLKAPPALIGTLAGIASAVTIPTALAIPWVVGHWGRPGGILRLSLGRMVGFLLLAGVAHWAAAAAGQMVLGVMAIVGTLVAVYSLELVDPEWRPTMTGATSLALGVGLAVAGFLGGPIIHAWGYGWLFGLASVLALAVGLGVWAYDRARRAPIPHGLS